MVQVKDIMHLVTIKPAAELKIRTKARRLKRHNAAQPTLSRLTD